jgi:pimeloyl-ACP methyl ester carboxylesterase
LRILTSSVAVDGGELAYERSGERGGVPVIAAHGITAHRHSWACTASFAPDIDLVAVDLRGRGESRALPGPSSIAQHADDLAALADALDVERVVVAGHSMGAFVAVALAGAHPDRVAGLMLLDGGLPFAPADRGDVPDLSLVIARLERTFSSREEYRAFWHAHPATGPYWSPAVEAYADADLHGEPPNLRAGANPELVREDTLDLVEIAASTDAIDRVSCPAIALRAPRGLLDEPKALYPPGWLQSLAADRSWLEVREIDDVNHYTIAFEDRSAIQVAQAIRDVRDGAGRVAGRSELVDG